MTNQGQRIKNIDLPTTQICEIFFQSISAPGECIREDRSISLMVHFNHVKDPRIERKKLHKLIDIIIIAICAIVAGADSFDAIEVFGNAHIDWFKKFLRLQNGIPSHDTFERVLSRINPNEFRVCFTNWTKSIAGIFTDIISLDGQTHRGARKKNLKNLKAWIKDMVGLKQEHIFCRCSINS